MYYYILGPWMRMLTVVISIIAIVLLIRKAIIERDSVKLRRKYVFSAVGILVLTPYLMFAHGLERSPIISATDVVAGCEQIENILSDIDCQSVVFVCKKGLGEISGEIQIYPDDVSAQCLYRKHPFTQYGSAHFENCVVDYSFSSVSSDREGRSLWVHNGYYGDVALYDCLQDQTIYIQYYQENPLTYLGFITALPPLQKFKVTDIADQEKTTFYLTNDNQTEKTGDEAIRGRLA